jgi:beta-glucosidase
VHLGSVGRSQLRGLVVGAEPIVVDDTIARAVEAARDADVAVVVVGTNAEWETEGEDRTTMDLPGAQDELIRRVAEVNPRTVVVINAGSPVTMPWADDVAAIMQVWFPGEEFGEALADVLFGVAEPGGRLPVTIPHGLADTPAFEHHPGRNGLAVYAEGLFIGHRWYDAQGIAPRFPFGHGLGYTTWTMGASSISGEPSVGVEVVVPVHNTGDRAGSTVVQCYVEPVQPMPGRPVRTLQAFAKVSAPGGGDTAVTLHLPPRAFSRWDPAAHEWVLVEGDHRIMLGWNAVELIQAGVSRAAEMG